MNPFSLFLYVLRSALLSSGGLGNVSSLHNSFIPTGYATDSQFVQAITVGQLAPGPNGLWVVSLGYLMLGPWGAVAAFIGILIPPFLVIGVEKLYRRVKHHPAVEGFVRGLNLAVAGVFVPVLIKLLQGSGIDDLKICLVALAFGLGWVRRIPVGAVIGTCGLIGILAGR
jgi:chromate transporter